MIVLNLMASGQFGGIERLSVDIFKKSEHKHCYCFLFGGGPVVDMLRSAGADVYILNSASKGLLRLCSDIKEYAKRQSAEAVIVHNASPVAWIAGEYLKRKTGIPFYIYAHGALENIVREGYDTKSRYFLRKAVFSYTSRKADKIIAISDYVKESIILVFPKLRHKIEVVYNGVDMDRFQAAQRDVHTGELNILYLGRLIRLKGVDLLLRALTLCNIPVRCTIVGDGDQREELKKLSKSLNIEDKIVFAGNQENTEEWYSKADVFVHPAVCQEGFGITIVESMASGVPCIAFRKGAIPEIITDGKDGFIIDAADERQLANKLDYVYDIIMNNPEKWDEYKASALKRAADFGIDKTAAGLDKAIDPQKGKI